VALTLSSLATFSCLGAMAFYLRIDQEQAAITLSLPIILFLSADALLVSLVGG
jgi:hypothetical protein